MCTTIIVFVSRAARSLGTRHGRRTLLQLTCVVVHFKVRHFISYLCSCRNTGLWKVVHQVTLGNEVYRAYALQLLSPDTHATLGSEAFIDGLWDSSGTVKDSVGRRLKWRAASDALQSWKKRESERLRETVDSSCEHLEEGGRQWRQQHTEQVCATAIVPVNWRRRAQGHAGLQQAGCSQGRARLRHWGRHTTI